MTKTPRFLRTITRHEDDILPVIVWFLSAHAVGILAAYVATEFFRWLGYTETVMVTLVGGTESSKIPWQLAEYYAMYVQMTIFIAVFAAFMLRNWRARKERE